MELTKGANAALTPLGDHVRAMLRWPAGDADADCSALLCGTDGKVLSDAHFVFYNAPSSPDGSVVHDGKRQDADGTTDTIEIHLAAVPADVDRIVLAASMDTCTFGSLPGPVSLELTGVGATLRFVIPDATTETALLFGEVYRRGAAWKLRAVGQGYATGLAGLATEFGVDIGDDSPHSAGLNDAAAPAAGTLSPSQWQNPPVPTGYER